VVFCYRTLSHAVNLPCQSAAADITTITTTTAGATATTTTTTTTTPASEKHVSHLTYNIINL
jgi:hypothetical protein